MAVGQAKGKYKLPPSLGIRPLFEWSVASRLRRQSKREEGREGGRKGKGLKSGAQ